MPVVVGNKILIDGVVVGSIEEYRNNTRVVVIGGTEDE